MPAFLVKLIICTFYIKIVFVGIGLVLPPIGQVQFTITEQRTAGLPEYQFL